MRTRWASATSRPPAGAGFIPYTRPFLYPNLAGCIGLHAPSAANGNMPGSPPTALGNNFSNCFSAAQRDGPAELRQVRLTAIASNLTWSNQAYYHYDYGRGIVAGPINQAGLPGLFAAYYPGLVVGGSTSSAGTLAEHRQPVRRHRQ